MLNPEDFDLNPLENKSLLMFLVGCDWNNNCSSMSTSRFELILQAVKEVEFLSYLNLHEHHEVEFFIGQLSKKNVNQDQFWPVYATNSAVNAQLRVASASDVSYNKRGVLDSGELKSRLELKNYSVGESIVVAMELDFTGFDDKQYFYNQERGKREFTLVQLKAPNNDELTMLEVKLRPKQNDEMSTSKNQKIESEISQTQHEFLIEVTLMNGTNKSNASFNVLFNTITKKFECGGVSINGENLRQNCKLIISVKEEANNVLLTRLYVLDNGANQDNTKSLFLKSNGTEYRSVETSLRDLSLVGASMEFLTINKFEFNNLNIQRVSIGTTMQNIIRKYLLQNATVCSNNCHIENHSTKGASTGVVNRCWMCSNEQVYDSQLGLCLDHCAYEKRNINGNCTNCLTTDCSIGTEDFTIKIKTSGANKMLLVPSIPINSYFRTNYYEDHFELAVSENGGEFVDVLFKGEYTEEEGGVLNQNVEITVLANVVLESAQLDEEIKNDIVEKVENDMDMGVDTSDDLEMEKDVEAIVKKDIEVNEQNKIEIEEERVDSGAVIAAVGIDALGKELEYTFIYM